MVAVGFSVNCLGYLIGKSEIKDGPITRFHKYYIIWPLFPLMLIQCGDGFMLQRIVICMPENIVRNNETLQNDLEFLV